jgi:hypothetical protein
MLGNLGAIMAARVPVMWPVQGYRKPCLGLGVHESSRHVTRRPPAVTFSAAGAGPGPGLAARGVNM